jgi:uncharacterized glyoxalase superfamily protein PhnB
MLGNDRRDLMKANLLLGFSGNCDAAFTFYELVFGPSG